MSKGNDTCKEGMKAYGTYPHFLQWILTGSEFKVWCYMSNNTIGNDPSKKLMCRRTNLNIKSVKKALWGLEMLRLVKPLGRDDHNTECYELYRVKPLFDLFSTCWINENKQKPKAISELKIQVKKYEQELKKRGCKIPQGSLPSTVKMEKNVLMVVLFSKFRGYFGFLPQVDSTPLQS